MLIDYGVVADHLRKYNINVRGVLHIGAHECEERGFYNNVLRISDDKIIWIDGNPQKVESMRRGGIPHIYEAVLDETERDVEFNITTNTQASSILELNHSKGYYTGIHIVDKIRTRTQTLSSFFEKIGKDSSDYNFWNLDIQGSELHVLRGSQELLKKCDAIYTEVNADEVYKGCGLITDLDALLKTYGFERIDTKWTDTQWGDALYIRTVSI